MTLGDSQSHDDWQRRFEENRRRFEQESQKFHQESAARLAQLERIVKEITEGTIRLLRKTQAREQHLNKSRDEQ